MNPLYILYALIVTFLWGGNFVAVKIGLEHFPPFFLLALRFAMVAAVLLPFYPRRTIDFGFVAAMSLVLGTIHFALVFGGMAYGIDIPTTVITVQLGVPFSCLLSAMFFKDYLGPWRSFGMVIAFIGIMLVAGTPSVAANFLPFVMLICGAFFWAVANTMMKKQGVVNILEMLAWMSLLTVPQLLLISWIVEGNQWELLMTTPLPAALSIAFSAIGSTVVAYGLWYYLLRHCDVSRISPFNLMVPFFGILLGQMFYDAPLSPQTLTGGLVTVAGVAVIVFRRPRLSTLLPVRWRVKT